MSIIELKNVSTVFGESPRTMLCHVKQGMSKAQLQDKYNHVLGLHDVNISVDNGEIFVIMGLSGSGKSTLLRHINCLHEPTDGNVYVNGTDITKLSQKSLKEFRRSNMSMVFQNFGLLPHKTVLYNAAYAQLIAGTPKKQAFESAKEWLQRVGLSEYASAYPSQLSGGQQQRVGLARAFAADTDIILMDEAFSALDPLIRASMQDELLALQQAMNKTIVFITHDVTEAFRIGSRVAILDDGCVTQIGTPEEIITNPANEYIESFVKDVNPVDILPLSTLVTPPELCIEYTEAATEVIRRMHESHSKHAWLVSGSRYKGYISQQSLNEALTHNPSISLIDAVDDVHAQHYNSNVADVLPAAIGNASPLPVIDEYGNFVGEVTPQAIVDVLRMS